MNRQFNDGQGQRATAIVDVHIVLVREGQVLLGRRQNTGFADGLWHLPAGHVEEGEPLPQAAAREAHEELGIRLDIGATSLLHVMHQPGRMAMFFAVPRWRGRIENREPHKCADLQWFPLRALPSDMTPYCREALERIRSSEIFSTFGWSDASERAA